MNFVESFSAAWESLVANKMRSILTMLGVIIGVSAVITMLALANGARESMMKNIQQLGTNVLIVNSAMYRRGAQTTSATYFKNLTLEDSEAILEKCSEVDKVAPEVASNAQVSHGNKNAATQILGTTPDYLYIRNYSVSEGRFFTDQEVRSASKVACIGSSAAENLFGESTPIGQIVQIRGIPFEIIGVMATKGTAGGFGNPDDQLFIPVSTAMRRVFGIDNVRSINVQAKSMDRMKEASAEIEALIRKRHRTPEGADSDLIIRSQSEFMEMANQAAGIFSMLLGGIASVSLLVGGIGIMNIMLVSVTERTREIGIRMAIGARRRDIRLQFMVEALVLSLLGGTFGILLGALASYLVNLFSELNTSVSTVSVVLSFGFSACVGIFFGYYPAKKASALDPIEALRYE